MENFDSMEGQCKIPELRVPYTMLENDFYLCFAGSPEYKTWLVLVRHIVRRPMTQSKLGQKIYDNFYENGLLCTARSQAAIADKLGVTQQAVAKNIKSMVEKGVIKMQYTTWRNRRVNVYEMGTHDKGPHKHETMHLVNYCAMAESEKILAELE